MNSAHNPLLQGPAAPSTQSLHKYIIEFIGTFFLVFILGCTAIPGSAGVVSPLVIGASLIVMIFSGGRMSGRHLNPAVTQTVFLRGRCNKKDIAPYMVAQIAAGLVAAIVANFVAGMGRPMGIDNTPAALVAEPLFTFGLGYVVLNLATAKAKSGNPFYGPAIGMTAVAGASAVARIYGGAFNPAVAVGAALMKLHRFSAIWIQRVADFASGAAAALVFKFLNPEDNQRKHCWSDLHRWLRVTV